MSNPSSPPTHTTQEPRRCWICLGEEEADSPETWVHPCPCSLMAHQGCLLKWVTESQRRNPDQPSQCPQCRTTYRLVQPRSKFIRLFQWGESIVHAVATATLVGGLTSCTLICMTTYGAFAVLTVCGAREGERLLGSPSPWSWRIWLGLPLIPVLLVGSRLSILDSALPLLPLFFGRRDDLVLTVPPNPSTTLMLLPWVRVAYNELYYYFFGNLEVTWYQFMSPGSAGIESVTTVTTVDNGQTVQRQIVETIPFVNGNVNRQVEVEEDVTNDAPDNLEAEDGTVTRHINIFLSRGEMLHTIVGALLFPTISAYCGKALGRLPFVRNWGLTPFHRSVLGGCFFVLAKDILVLCYKYTSIQVQKRRTILDYSE
ncbi:hypothetical protein IWQ62_004007 [Dispira parvispora]|uniref:RING-CH-type domain-containing protein n=1 Tax=Dispira parvispora TaxID=1520584 RepID=A0A9W8ASP9_9FUNG|nr:hypothetical protein IWQ62_004007 [Dispira parvispora]